MDYASAQQVVGIAAERPDTTADLDLIIEDVNQLASILGDVHGKLDAFLARTIGPQPETANGAAGPKPVFSGGSIGEIRQRLDALKDAGLSTVRLTGRLSRIG